MSDKSISRISELIADDNYLKPFDSRNSFKDIEFAINELQTMLSTEKTREHLIENELSEKIKSPDTNELDLEKYLIKTQENIGNLLDFIDILTNKQKSIILE